MSSACAALARAITTKTGTGWRRRQ
jgi:hypothetical protein